MSMAGETGLEPVDAAAIPQRKLYTLAAMPAVGLGTFGSHHVRPNDVAAAVRGAGRGRLHRHFDCARCLGTRRLSAPPSKRSSGGGVRREELWVISKLWNDMHGEEDVTASCGKSLADLHLGYLDLFLVHWPFPDFHPPAAT